MCVILAESFALAGSRRRQRMTRRTPLPDATTQYSTKRRRRSSHERRISSPSNFPAYRDIDDEMEDQPLMNPYRDDDDELEMTEDNTDMYGSDEW